MRNLTTINNFLHPILKSLRLFAPSSHILAIRYCSNRHIKLFPIINITVYFILIIITMMMIIVASLC